MAGAMANLTPPALCTSTQKIIDVTSLVLKILAFLFLVCNRVLVIFFGFSALRLTFECQKSFLV